jgi:hypothetical protein
VSYCQILVNGRTVDLLLYRTKSLLDGAQCIDGDGEREARCIVCDVIYKKRVTRKMKGSFEVVGLGRMTASIQRQMGNSRYKCRRRRRSRPMRGIFFKSQNFDYWEIVLGVGEVEFC